MSYTRKIHLYGDPCRSASGAAPATVLPLEQFLRIREGSRCVACSKRALSATPLPAPHSSAKERVPSPADQFLKAVLSIIGELMQKDHAAHSVEGRLLVKLADAVGAYERGVYPLGEAGVPECRPDLTHCPRCNNNNDRCPDGVPASIAKCDKCADPSWCVGDACKRGFAAHADGGKGDGNAQG